MNWFKTTVDDILSNIARKIAKLHVVAAVHADARDAHHAEINARIKLADAAHDESTRAERIAAKFEELVK